MSSKQLDSILKNIPSATVTAERAEAEADIIMVKKKEETESKEVIVPFSVFTKPRSTTLFAYAAPFSMHVVKNKSGEKRG